MKKNKSIIIKKLNLKSDITKKYQDWMNEIIKIAKKKKIKKLKASAYEMNIGSKKVLIKNGFKVEGRLKSAVIFKKKRYASYIFGKVI